MIFVMLLKILTGTPCIAFPSADSMNISYGEDPRQRMDVWLANSNKSTSVVVYIHGGGWYGGTKNLKPGSKWEQARKQLLDDSISFISIDYRVTGSGNTLPVPVYDAARAIQFIRSKAEEWNIDKTRIAVCGGSAGGATCLWLLFHDDLADLESADPVARESTRVKGAVVQNGQSKIDPYWIEAIIGIEGAKHPMISKAVGEEDLNGVHTNYEKHKALYAEFSALNHLDKDDPPYFGIYNGTTAIPATDPGAGIHHSLFGDKLKEKSDNLGHIGYLSSTPGQPFDDEIHFLKTMLK